jgi:hypothetical protein
MSPVNSRAKGKRAELDLAKFITPWYPEACRNLDQFGPKKMDLIEVADLHIQCKHVEKLNVWNALDQAITEATEGRLPVLAFKRNWSASSLPSRSKWFGALELDELLPLLKQREA